MGYYSKLTESNFFITKNNFQKVIIAMWKYLNGRKDDIWQKTKIKETLIANIDIDENGTPIFNADIHDVFTAIGWPVNLDNEGNITGIDTDEMKHYYDFDIFNAIAPYVNNGCYLQMQGEDGAIWRWIFENGKCIEKKAIITF